MLSSRKPLPASQPTREIVRCGYFRAPHSKITDLASRLLTASYWKTAEGVATNNYAWVQQFVYQARTAEFYRIKAHYKVLSHNKGASCPDASLPLTSCKLKVSYVDQVIKNIQLHPTSGYVEINVPFTPESGGRYLHFNLECKPDTTTPGCGEATLLLDDITWNDPGHVCWTPLGCHVDSSSNRLLPHHGRLPLWPRTTSIDTCQEACDSQGHTFAGLENGIECYCGDSLVGSVPAPASECNKPCSWNTEQLCGGVNRVDVYQKP